MNSSREEERKKKEAEALETKARFKLRTPCLRCLDVGILKVKIDSLATLARCSCKSGRELSYVLPLVTEIEPEFESPLPESLFKPPPELSLTLAATHFILEKISWWREKLKLAEEYWAHNKPKSPDKPLRRDPYSDT